MRKKDCFIIFIMLCHSITPSHVRASPQVLNGASPPLVQNLNSDGENDGVSFINQTTNEDTLIVPGDSVINSNKNEYGIQTDADGYGNVQFDGGSDKSTKVYGKVGDLASLYMDNFVVGGATVTFFDAVHCKHITFVGNGVVNLNANLDLIPGGSIQFGGYSATLNLSENTVLTGNIGSFPAPSGGTVNMKESSQIIGDVATNILHFDSGKNNHPIIIGNVYANEVSVGLGEYFYQSPEIQGNLGTNLVSSERIPISVQGDLTLNNATLRVGQNDGGNMIVGGSTTINGDVNLFYTFRVKPRPTKFELTYLIVSSTGGGTNGATINLLNEPDWRMTFFAQNVNGNIVLTNQQSFGPPSPPFNTGCPWWLQGILGGCDDEVMLQLTVVADDHIGSDLDFIERQLGEPTWEAYTLNLYQLYPAPALIGVARESFNTTKQFQKTLLKQLDHRRNYCGSYFTQTYCPCDLKPTKIDLWTEGFGYVANQSNSDPGKGYESIIGGIAGGFEIPVRRNLNAGAGFGYASTSIQKGKFLSSGPQGNRTDVNNYQLALYVNYDPSKWFLDAGVSFGWNRYHQDRHIEFNDVHRQAKATYNGQEYSAFFATGYQLCNSCYEFTPFFSLIYSHLHIDRYHEKGAQSLDLQIKDQNYNYLESGLGLKASSSLNTRWGILSPEVHAMWLHDFYDESVSVDASFSEAAAEAGFFKQTVPPFARNFWNVGVGVTSHPCQCLTVLLDYDFEWSYNYYNNQGLIKLTYAF